MNKNIFEGVPVPHIKTNHFDLSHDLKYSFNMGNLIPTTVIDCVPGDKFKIGYENMLRFSPLLAPIMHRVTVSTHYFFVPNRILFNNQNHWEDILVKETQEHPWFIPQIIDPEGDPLPYKYGIAKGSLCDYMGIPPFANDLPGETPTPIKLNALPFAAYWLIWYEYYMDQNNYPYGTWFEQFMAHLYPGDNTGDYTEDPYFGVFSYACGTRLAPRAWNHDYFTSALPTAQKGEDVFIPLSAPVVSPFTDGEALPRDPLIVRNRTTDSPTPSQSMSTNASGVFLAGANAWIDGQVAENTEGDGTIANLRRAIKLQEYLEIKNAVGSRYTEYLLGMFGVHGSDKRLSRPEYLGGSKQHMVISEVLSTAQTINGEEEVVNPVGALSGHGISVGSRNMFNYYCEEHGWLIGLISVMPDTAYMDGLARKFSRNNTYDYFLPKFQLIGDQAILQKELQHNPYWDEEVQNQTFGYVPRYSEYKYEQSRVAGDFRDTLDFWHLARKFDQGVEAIAVNLNEDFIYPVWEGLGQAPAFDRIFAVPSTVADTIQAYTLNIVHAHRPMVRFGLPSI